MCPEDELSTSETPESAGLGGREPETRDTYKNTQEGAQHTKELFFSIKKILNLLRSYLGETVDILLLSTENGSLFGKI